MLLNIVPVNCSVHFIQIYLVEYAFIMGGGSSIGGRVVNVSACTSNITGLFQINFYEGISEDCGVARATSARP